MVSLTARCVNEKGHPWAWKGRGSRIQNTPNRPPASEVKQIDKCSRVSKHHFALSKWPLWIHRFSKWPTLALACAGFSSAHKRSKSQVARTGRCVNKTAVISSRPARAAPGDSHLHTQILNYQMSSLLLMVLQVTILLEIGKPEFCTITCITY